MSESPTFGGEEAEQALANLNEILDRLTETIEAETAHARAGELSAVATLGGSKLDLARRYHNESRRLTASLAQVQPDALARLRERHVAFHSLLQTNLTVLATAHAVAQDIIRGVSRQLARKRMPSTYGASGRPDAPTVRAAQPLALSRTL
jgi:hypothetical protein